MPYLLRKRRERLGMTQEEIGLQLGWSYPQPQVSACERYYRVPKDHVEAISRLLDTEEKARGLQPLPTPRDHHLAERRERLKLSMFEVAELAGLPVGNHGVHIVRAAENGDGTPDEVFKIRRLLD